MTGTDLRRILSKNLKKLRTQRSLSQIELAEKANISIPFLSNIERCNKWPYPDTLTRLAEALDVEVCTLFQGNKEPVLDHTQDILNRFKKDISTSLHKMVSKAIDSSLENITTLYEAESPEES